MDSQSTVTTRTLKFLSMDRMNFIVAKKVCFFTPICISIVITNSFLANGDLCYMLIAFANSLDPDQDLYFVGPDLEPNRLTL